MDQILSLKVTVRTPPDTTLSHHPDAKLDEVLEAFDSIDWPGLVRDRIEERTGLKCRVEVTYA